LERSKTTETGQSLINPDDVLSGENYIFIACPWTMFNSQPFGWLTPPRIEGKSDGNFVTYERR